MMTNWERWLGLHNRKDIVCALESYANDGACPKGRCILYPVCTKTISSLESYYDECELLLDSEYAMDRDTVIIRLALIRADAESNGYAGDVAVLTKAIELLKGEADGIYDGSQTAK